MPNWLGDSVMAVGALRNLSKEFKVYLLGKPWLGELFYGEDFYQGIYPFRHIFSCTPIREIGLLLPNSFSSALNFIICGLRRRIGYPKDMRGPLLTDRVKWEREHQVLQYLRLAEYLMGKKLEAEVRLTPPVQEKEIDVVLIPGGSKASKRWPAENYRELGERLREKRLSVLYVGSEKEKELLQEASGNLPYSTPNILGLKEILARARIVCGNDTGPIHLADAMGTTVLSLFGSTTHPELTAPWNQRENIIKKDNLKEISVQEVFERLMDLV